MHFLSPSWSMIRCFVTRCEMAKFVQHHDAQAAPSRVDQQVRVEADYAPVWIAGSIGAGAGSEPSEFNRVGNAQSREEVRGQCFGDLPNCKFGIALAGPVGTVADGEDAPHAASPSARMLAFVLANSCSSCRMR